MTAASLQHQPQVLAHIMRRIRFDHNGCWLWNGATVGGYGAIKVEGRSFRLHRLVYELIEGPVAEGLHLDHLCRQPGCCNPQHLEPVTPRENTLRGFGLAAINARKTECPKGHPLVEGNLAAHPKHGRACLICKREREQTRRDQFPEIVREQQRRYATKWRRLKKERERG